MEQEYIKLIKYILKNGVIKNNRTNINSLSIFGYQMKFNIEDNFPLITTKQCHFKSIVHELLWFLNGDTNIKYLNENNVTIWNEWADENGNLGKIYGKQWRSWESKNGQTIDQITNVINEIKSNPNSRRLIVNSWNVSELNEMMLPPCHLLFQFDVTNDKLSCHLYQRSADVFLGLPFNIASYSLLTYMIAHVCNLKPGFFVHSIGDAHIYSNHIEQCKLQITRIPYPFPKIKLNEDIKNIFDFKYKDIELLNYKCYNKILGKVAI